MQNNAPTPLRFALLAMALIGPVAIGQDTVDEEVAAPPSIAPFDEWEWTPEVEEDEHLSWLDRFRHETNSRVALDLIFRGVRVEGTDGIMGKQAVGIDYYKTFGDSKQWGELVLQGYLIRLDNVPMPPPDFDDGHDWEFFAKTTNFNYTGIGGGWTNLRIGHFDTPYGLEHLLDTNLSLEQTVAAQNLGNKRDWGISLNGGGKSVEYEVAVVRGSGLRYRDAGGPLAFVGRVGTDRTKNTVFGFSAHYGDIIAPANSATLGALDPSFTPPADSVVTISRLGIDAQRSFGDWTLLGELSGGRDERQEVVNSFLAVKWDPVESSFRGWAQLRTFFQRSSAWQEAVSAVAGLRFSPSPLWGLGIQVEQDLTRFDRGENLTSLAVQLRIRL